MPENVVITLRFQGAEADFELPVRKPLSALEEPLRRAARLQFPGAAFHGKRLLLKNNAGYLRPEYTLADYGVFDGSILELELTDSEQGGN